MACCLQNSEIFYLVYYSLFIEIPTDNCKIAIFFFTTQRGKDFYLFSFSNLLINKGMYPPIVFLGKSIYLKCHNSFSLNLSGQHHNMQRSTNSDTSMETLNSTHQGTGAVQMRIKNTNSHHDRLSQTKSMILTDVGKVTEPVSQMLQIPKFTYQTEFYFLFKKKNSFVLVVSLMCSRKLFLQCILFCLLMVIIISPVAQEELGLIQSDKVDLELG